MNEAPSFYTTIKRSSVYNTAEECIQELYAQYKNVAIPLGEFNTIVNEILMMDTHLAEVDMLESEIFCKTLNFNDVFGDNADLLVHVLIREGEGNKINNLLDFDDFKLKINSTDENGLSAFINLANDYVVGTDFPIDYRFMELLKHGYTLGIDDRIFVENGIRKSHNSKLHKWAMLLAIVRLELIDELNLLITNKQAFFTILSIKQKRILFYKYDDFWDLFNNALNHKTGNCEIIIKAIEYYGVDKLLKQTETIKNNYKSKVDLFHSAKIEQDTEFEKIIHKLFGDFLAP